VGGVLLRDLVFDGRGNEDVARLEEYVPRAHFRSAAGKILQRLLLIGDPVDYFGNIEAVFVVQGAANIRQADNSVSGLLHQVGRHRSNISKSLDDGAATF